MSKKIGPGRALARRLVTAGALGTLTLAGAALPAAAASPTAGPVATTGGRPEVFGAAANGTALDLSLPGLTLTSGISRVGAGSDLAPVAEAVGSIVNGAVQDHQTSQVSGPDQTQVQNEQCGTPALPTLPAPLPTISAGIACAATAVSTLHSLPVSAAVGRVASLDFNAVPTINTVLQTVLDPIQQIFGQLNKVAPQLDPATSTVTDLLNAVGTTNTLSTRLGDTTSTVTTEGTSVVSTAKAAGGEIDILGLASAAPVAKIEVGSSASTVTYNRATGQAVPSFDPALVRVTVDPLGLSPQTFTVAPGQSLDILQGTPLESVISVASGSTTKNPDGSLTATASAVTLHLLEGIGASSATATDGGIKLALAETSATAGGTPAVAPTPVPAPPTQTKVAQLPFTGSTPAAPLAGGGLLAVGIVARRLWRRMR